MALDPASAPPRQWALILPLKGGPAAKSRLGGGPALARAIAMDCLETVLACTDVRQVLVVTADPGTATEATTAGADVVRERRPGAGLVAAVRDGVAAAPGGPAAVLLGDLPALRPADLTLALRTLATALDAGPTEPAEPAAEPTEPPIAPLMAAVPDAEGTGTVLLAALAAHRLDPAFGPDSLSAHRRRGAVVVVPDLGPDAARLRRDVDTPADLDVALRLGVGPRTAAALRRARSAS